MLRLSVARAGLRKPVESRVRDGCKLGSVRHFWKSRGRLRATFLDLSLLVEGSTGPVKRPDINFGAEGVRGVHGEYRHAAIKHFHVFT